MAAEREESGPVGPQKFNIEEANAIFKEVCEQVLVGQTYHPSLAPEWIKKICESSLQKLSSLEKPFKYMLSCSVIQKKGGGIHTSSSCYWDQNTDASTIYKWESKAILATISFFASFDSSLQ